MNISVVNISIYSILVLWLFLILLFQFELIRNKIIGILKPHSFFLEFIPVWSLFSPNPLVSDYQIVYRDYINNNLSTLKLLKINYVSILNNRYEKSFITIVLKLIRSNDKGTELQNHIEYKKLKLFIKHYKWNKLITKRQFHLVKTYKKDDELVTEVLFSSIIKY